VTSSTPASPRPSSVSVIVPVHNGAAFLAPCLTALQASDLPPHEIIVVDDASTDGSGDLARGHGVTVVTRDHRAGAAIARNAGAHAASGDVFLFVDADCVVRPDTVARLVRNLETHPDVVAVFGSYDDAPADPHFLSQYRNLLHHFVHQQGSSEATTFWTGCGGVRRAAFERLGGFDPRHADVEDIEFGYRLRAHGYRILLDHDLLVKHLKVWRFWGMLRTDVLGRAVPWSRLLLQRKQMVDDLNISRHHRISAVLAGLTVVLLLGAPFEPRLLFILALVLAAIVALNHDLYGFFVRKRGLVFAVAVLPLHVLYYLYSSVTFVICWIEHCFAEGRSSDLSASRPSKR
jgi:glycosyltransferase involved in cell wall biosynthesis